MTSDERSKLKQELMAARDRQEAAAKATRKALDRAPPIHDPARATAAAYALAPIGWHMTAGSARTHQRAHAGKIMSANATKTPGVEGHPVLLTFC